MSASSNSEFRTVATSWRLSRLGSISSWYKSFRHNHLKSFTKLRRLGRAKAWSSAILTQVGCYWRRVGRNMPSGRCHCKEASHRALSLTHKKKMFLPLSISIRILKYNSSCNLWTFLDHLFFSTPMRNAASASEARRLPLPASFGSVTAYSLTNTWIWTYQSQFTHCLNLMTPIRKRTTPNGASWGLIYTKFILLDS